MDSSSAITLIMYILRSSGANPRYQVRGAQLKKLRRAEGCAKIVGVFRVKNHNFAPKNHIVSNFRGGGGGGGGVGAKTGRHFGINLNEVIDRFIWTIEFCHI